MNKSKIILGFALMAIFSGLAWTPGQVENYIMTGDTSTIHIYRVRIDCEPWYIKTGRELKPATWEKAYIDTTERGARAYLDSSKNRIPAKAYIYFQEK